MYAIIATGGKQFKVEKDQIIKVEKLDANKGDKVTLDVVMLADDKHLTVVRKHNFGRSYACGRR